MAAGITMPMPTTHTTKMEVTMKAILKKLTKTSTTINIMTKVAMLLVSKLHIHKMATGRHIFPEVLGSY